MGILSPPVLRSCSLAPCTANQGLKCSERMVGYHAAENRYVRRPRVFVTSQQYGALLAVVGPPAPALCFRNFRCAAPIRCSAPNLFPTDSALLTYSKQIAPLPAPLRSNTTPESHPAVHTHFEVAASAD